MSRFLTALFADPPTAGYTYTGGGEAHHGDPTLGWLMVAGVVAVIVFFAWLVARIGDIDRVSDRPPP